MRKEAIEFFKSNFGKQLFFYFLFYVFMWSFHLILISLVSFFHLLLEHNIRTIGDWIGDRGWLLIIISKLGVFYIAALFINLKAKKLFSIKSYFKNNIQMPRIENYVSFLFLLIALLGLGKYKFNSSMIVELDRLVLSMLGSSIFFAVDFIVLIVLDVFYPIKESGARKKRLFFFPLCFYIFSASTFIYEQTISLKLYGFFLLLLYIGQWRRENWNLPLFFLLGFILPAYSFMGLDPVWGEIYSPLIPEKKIDTISFFILIGFTLAYLEYSKRKEPEYIYRD